jgi:hypothetical protein
MYPKIVTCRMTGISSVVRNQEEECAFKRAPLIGVALGLLVCGAVIAIAELVCPLA